MVLSSVDLISNIDLLTSEELTGEPNEKEPTSNEEPSPDNDKVTTFDFIPPPDGARAFYYAKYVVLVGKTDL